MRGLRGRVAIITGGGSGIGEAICYRLADEGVKISILDRNPKGAERVFQAIRDRGGVGHVEELDISDYKAVQRAVENAEPRISETLHRLFGRCESDRRSGYG